MMSNDSFENPALNAIRGITHSVVFKILAIGVLVLLLLAPLKMIQSLISEREARKDEAIAEISAKWGGSQTIGGPVLVIPYRESVVKEDKKTYTYLKHACFLPEKLTMDGTVNPEVRYRGIYKAVLYNANLAVSAVFDTPDFSGWNIPEENILWNNAMVYFVIPDKRGIKNEIEFTWNGDHYKAQPGSVPGGAGEPAIVSNVAVSDLPRDTKFSFSTRLDLNGSGMLNFHPLGKVTSVALKSPWNNPSFNGAFLPEKREITADGFSAAWNVLYYNRDFPQRWNDANYSFDNSAFGVSLLVPVNEYQKISRATKYAVLFIALTFLTFFIIEILNKKRVHAIQYILIGLGLSLFYTLLLSLSEYISFSWAYAGAGVAILSLTGFYTKAVLKSWRLSAVLFALIALLYTFLYVILQLRDFSLLFGSAGLFVILAIVMFVTRKIDWYSIGAVENKRKSIEISSPA